MKTLLGWIVVLSVIFFGVGEFAGGWYLGVPSQTPLLVYKKNNCRSGIAAYGYGYGVSV